MSRNFSELISDCAICHESAPFWHDLHDDRHGYPGHFAYHRCPACGLIFQRHFMDAAVLARLYSEYYPRSVFSEADWQPYTWSPSLASWLAGRSSAYMYIPESVRILDIGCGFGNALGYHRDRRCSVHGTEMDANAQRIAAAQHLDIRHGVFNPADWEPASFDYVTLDQVLEHIYEPLQLLRDIRVVVKPGGTLLLTTPNAGSLTAKLFGQRWIHCHPPYHVMLYTRTAVARVLHDAGFIVEKIRTVTASAWMQYQFIHNRMHGEEGEKSPFWDPRATRELSLKEERWLRLADRLHRSHVFSLATRLLDCSGAGDNLIVWARPAE